jgi:hypothetical protein
VCRFVKDGSGDLVCSLNYRGKGLVARWQFRQGITGRLCAQSASISSPVTGLDVSPGGDFVGICTSEGEVLTLGMKSLRARYSNRKAHMVFGTEVAFAADDGAFVSTSADASARVTQAAKGSAASSRLLYLFLMAVLLVVGAVAAILFPGLRDSALDTLWDDIREMVENLQASLKPHSRQSF